MKNTYVIASLFFWLGFAPLLHAQLITQLGSDFDGQNVREALGKSVALSHDGSIMAIGADGFNNAGSSGCYVSVFRWDGNNWAPMGASIQGIWNTLFGYKVKLSADGHRLAVSAISHYNRLQRSSGRVTLYEWDGTTWVQMGAEIVGPTRADIWLGFDLALSDDGNRVAVTATHVYPRQSNGKTRVYDWDGTAWTQVGQDLQGTLGDYFGSSVALSANGNRMAIGAMYALPAGQVQVYDWNGASWVQAGPTISSDTLDSQCGYSVSLSDDGQRLAVGIPRNYAMGRYAGEVRTYEWSNGTWQQLGQDLNAQGPDYSFGQSVSLSADGERLLVGAPFDPTYAPVNQIGEVSLYQWNGTAWVLHSPSIVGEAHNDWFGNAVALAGNGRFLAVGGPNNSESDTLAGHVRAYGICAKADTTTTRTCQSYAWIDGHTYTQDTVLAHLMDVPASNGCDSIRYLFLDIVDAPAPPLVVVSCQQYTWRGQTYTTSGLYGDTLTSVLGCDSLFLLDLTVQQQFQTQLNVDACDQYVWHGQTLTNSGTYTDTLISSGGCDSIITLQLNLPQLQRSNQFILSCGPYFWGGQLRTTSGVYRDTVAFPPCGIETTLHLTIQQTTSSFTQNGHMLTANALPNASYQWIDCHTGQPISGATNAQYTVTTSGDYALVTTANRCSDTSACLSVVFTQLSEVLATPTPRLYPNPTKDRFTLDLGASYPEVTLRLRSLDGRLIHEQHYDQLRQATLKAPAMVGVYLLEIQCGHHVPLYKKIIKN